MTTGRVHQLNVSNGGVPKTVVSEAVVTTSGMAGDRQADQRHHGGPLQTLCLYSLDVIEALRAEGHPIEPGFAGENVTIAGITWSDVGPGMHLCLGDDLLIEVTEDATPCSKNAGWFLEGDFRRMSHDRHPGWSRWYAVVLEPGLVRAGDPVTVLEPGPAEGVAE